MEYTHEGPQEEERNCEVFRAVDRGAGERNYDRTGLSLLFGTAICLLVYIPGGMMRSHEDSSGQASSHAILSDNTHTSTPVRGRRMHAPKREVSYQPCFLSLATGEEEKSLMLPQFHGPP